MSAIPQEEAPSRRAVLAYAGGLAATAFAAPKSAHVNAAGSDRRITAWLTRYDWKEAVQSLGQHSGTIEAVSPSWYDLTKEGTVVESPGARVRDPALAEIVARSSLPVRPLVMNVTSARTQPEFVRQLFVDTAARLVHHQKLRTLATDSNYEGIVLDYEGLRLPDMPSFTKLVRELSAVLHGVGKKLGVCVEALSDPSIAGYWESIAASADTVYVMAYGQKPQMPGPFVSLGWLSGVVGRATLAIPPEKLVLGLAVYGLSWNAKGVSSGTWQQYVEKAIAAGATLERDQNTGMIFYIQGNEQVWCEDSVSISAKMRIGWRSGIRRFAFWRLGGEDPDIWRAVSALP